MGWYGLDRSGSGYGQVEGSCGHDDEPSGSIKCWEVLEWLHSRQLLKKGSVFKYIVLVHCTLYKQTRPLVREGAQINKPATVRQSRKSQMGTSHQDRLTDWPWVVTLL
jgi:hypothetical protein